MKKYQPGFPYNGNDEYNKKYCLGHEIFSKLSNLSQPSTLSNYK